eukprot:2456326-Rhodomonas_salina.1
MLRQNGDPVSNVIRKNGGMVMVTGGSVRNNGGRPALASADTLPRALGQRARVVVNHVIRRQRPRALSFKVTARAYRGCG